MNIKMTCIILDKCSSISQTFGTNTPAVDLKNVWSVAYFDVNVLTLHDNMTVFVAGWLCGGRKGWVAVAWCDTHHEWLERPAGYWHGQLQGPLSHTVWSQARGVAPARLTCAGLSTATLAVLCSPPFSWRLHLHTFLHWFYNGRNSLQTMLSPTNAFTDMTGSVQM